LECPDFSEYLRVLNCEELPIHGVVDQQVHEFTVSYRDSRGLKLFINRKNSDINVLQILLLEGLVLEHFVTKIHSDIVPEII
jgi:hypothetical protein